MPDVPNVWFINLVDNPAVLNYSQHGQAQVPLDPQTGSIIDVTDFRRVNILIGSTKASSCVMYMGKISGTTLSQSFSVPLDSSIHTFKIVGPHMNLWLMGGQPNTTENVQLWVYLTS
jgi:hypothetical protein